jgi:sortase (surface protein transpeptidase)
MGWWRRLPSPRRRALVVTVAAAALAVGAGFVAMAGESPAPVVAERITTPTVGATSIIDPGTPVAAIATAEMEPTEVGLPTLTNLKDLRDRFGDPPSARRGRFRIPRIGVDAPLGIRAVPANLQLPSPAGPADVVLYDFGAAGDSWGGMPGGGNAIFSGHVDYSYRLPYVEANYHGRAVFFDLRVLAPGDEISIVIDGLTFTYAVAWKRTLPASGGVWGEVLTRDVGADAITLVTCDGDFNPATQEYNARTVVRAVRV